MRVIKEVMVPLNHFHEIRSVLVLFVGFFKFPTLRSVMRGLLDAEETNNQYQDRSEPAKSTVKPTKESKNAGDVRARRSALD